MFALILWLLLIFLMAFAIAPATFFTTAGVLLIFVLTGVLILWIYSKIKGNYPPIEIDRAHILRQKLKDIGDWERVHQRTHPARQTYENELNTLLNA